MGIKNLKRSLAILLCSTALSPLVTPFASYFYPTGADALKELGLRPEIAEELAPGMKIRVLSGVVAETLDNIEQWKFKFPRRTSGQASAFSSEFNLYNMSGNCLVNMPRFSIFSAEEFITAATGISRAEIKNAGITKKEAYAYVLLHEMRHCGQGGNDSSMQHEGDADVASAKTLAKEFNNPEITKWVFNMRAAKFPSKDVHDVSLYLDAALNGKPVPAIDELVKANKTALDIIKKIHSGQGKTALNDAPAPARKRIDFLIEGYDYIKTQPANTKPAAPKIS